MIVFLIIFLKFSKDNVYLYYYKENKKSEKHIDYSAGIRLVYKDLILIILTMGLHLTVYPSLFYKLAVIFF